MQLTLIETEGQVLRAGYDCPCGCTPSATYQRGGAIAVDVCCCGNEFALGRRADARLLPKAGFALESIDVPTPWDEPVKAAWLVGSSVHPEPNGDAGQHDHQGHDHDDGASGVAIDPVCGMSVDPPTALERGLHVNYKDLDYFFCGKGCMLEFRDDPEKYLDPSHVPSM